MSLSVRDETDREYADDALSNATSIGK